MPWKSTSKDESGKPWGSVNELSKSEHITETKANSREGEGFHLTKETDAGTSRTYFDGEGNHQDSTLTPSEPKD